MDTSDFFKTIFNSKIHKSVNSVANSVILNNSVIAVNSVTYYEQVYKPEKKLLKIVDSNPQFPVIVKRIRVD